MGFLLPCHFNCIAAWLIETLCWLHVVIFIDSGVRWFILTERELGFCVLTTLINLLDI
jgi:hypothetical protein